MTRSSSPLLSCGSASSGSPSVRVSSIAGCLARNSLMASGISVAPADSKAAMRRRPPLRPAMASSSASASASRASTASAWRTNAAPVALHQDGPGLALERGDLLRHGGLGEGERFRGGGERTLDGDFPEDAHAADIEHELSLYERQRNVICATGSARPPLLSHRNRPAR